MTSQTPNAGKDQRAPGLALSLAISLTVASVIHFLVLQRGFYSATLDESGRTLDAYNWMRGNEPLTTAWLPFYKLVVGGSLFLVPDLFITPRIISYLFGMTALFALVWFSHMLFKDQTTTLLTGLVGAVFPVRVIFSVVPLAEIMLIALIIPAMAFLDRWFSAGRNRDLYVSAALFAVGSTVRYEGWVFAGMFSVVLSFLCLNPVNTMRMSFKAVSGPLLMSCSFMILWIGGHYIAHGKAFGFVTDTTERYALIHGDSVVSLLSNNPLTQFVLQNGWTLNILGVLSIPAFARKNTHHMLVILLPALALLIVSTIALLGKGMPTHGFWRIPALWSVLLIPLTANWFAVRLDPRHPPARLRRVGLVSLLIAVLALCLYRTYSMTEHSAFSTDDLATGRYVHAQLLEQTSESSHKVLIESGIWSYLNVMIASRQPEHFVLNSGFDPVAPGEPLLNPDVPFDGATLQGLDIGLLVFRREDYKGYLDARAEVRRLNDFGPWTVYAFVPPQSAISP